MLVRGVQRLCGAVCFCDGFNVCLCDAIQLPLYTVEVLQARYQQEKTF